MILCRLMGWIRGTLRTPRGHGTPVFNASIMSFDTPNGQLIHLRCMRLHDLPETLTQISRSILNARVHFVDVRQVTMLASFPTE